MVNISSVGILILLPSDLFYSLILKQGERGLDKNEGEIFQCVCVVALDEGGLNILTVEEHLRFTTRGLPLPQKS